MTHPRAYTLALLALLGLSVMTTAPGCDSPPRQKSNLATVPLKIGSRTYTLEVANTYGTRERGLMYRDSIDDDGGMIFVFPSEQPLSFYMKNTRIPLDILYVNAASQVVSIHALKPHDLTGIDSAAPARWAIELREGEAKRSGVRVGDHLPIPDPAREAKR